MPSSERAEFSGEIKSISDKASERFGEGARDREKKRRPVITSDDADTIEFAIERLLITDTVATVWNYYRAICHMRALLGEERFKICEDTIHAWMKLKELHFVERKLTMG